MIASAKENNLIKGIKVAVTLFITHTLFVDDVLIFGDRKVLEWQHIKSLIDTFHGASRMSISERESVLFHSCNCQETMDNIAHFFPYSWKQLGAGLIYLGFRLKPNNYLIVDWSWLLKKFQGRMNRWVPRWLLLGGRVTLVSSVLHSIPVF